MFTKHQKIFIGSMTVALLIFAAPAFSFAQVKNQKDLKNFEVRENRAQQNNSWRGMFSSFFGTKVSQAQTRNQNGNGNANNKAPVISGITAPTVLKTGQVGTWKVSASDPENGSLSYSVDWGISNGITALRSPSQSFVQTSTFTNSYSNPGVYKVSFVISDDKGARTETSVTVYVTGDPIVSPEISNLVATSTDSNNGKVSWTTNVPTDSSVWISESSPVSTEVEATYYSEEEKTSHEFDLSDLKPQTTYYVVVGSSNVNGEVLSEEISFTTPEEVVDLSPVIVDITATSTVFAGETQTVTVNAYDPQNSSLSYSVDWGDNQNFMRLLAVAEDPFVQTSTFSHIYYEPGTYIATFTVKNEEGLETSGTITTVVLEEPDTQGPVITDGEVSVGETTATVSWITDEPSKSKVFYIEGETIDIENENNLSVSSDELKTSHSFDLVELKADTTYSFIVQSTDESGNTSTLDQSYFVTDPEQQPEE